MLEPVVEPDPSQRPSCRSSRSPCSGTGALRPSAGICVGEPDFAPAMPSQERLRADVVGVVDDRLGRWCSCASMPSCGADRGTGRRRRAGDAGNAPPAASAPATIVAPSSFEVFMRSDLLGRSRATPTILRPVAKETCRCVVRAAIDLCRDAIRAWHAALKARLVTHASDGMRTYVRALEQPDACEDGEQRRLPGYREEAVVRRFDAPEAVRDPLLRGARPSVLNRVPDKSRMPFRWTINPYRRLLVMRAVYCFARPTHRYLDFDAGRDFEREIVVKVNAPRCCARSSRGPRGRASTSRSGPTPTRTSGSRAATS